MGCVPRQLFGSAVAYYARYRPGYPQDLVDAVAARAGLDGTQRVLDIGCGTGQITIPLARHARAILAIDPVADMLARGCEAAQAAGRATSPGWRATPARSPRSPGRAQIWRYSPRRFTGPTGPPS